eukprot:TRINITY_DN30783_c0_g1_i1.p1 TRINITY_DN30783_c0_g1~~TRINITY_DN30783_c0_g1_i1.p1  ORF type:complete len:231 (+),score=31.69 TRINITY_DN30783_c0_g1_i1:73-693(+)
MAPIKFTYFDFAAMGEPVRLALAQSGVEWEDIRVPRADWPAMKPTTPNGQLPIMEVDGALIPQSFAQIRYVGKIGGLYPTDPIQAAFADAAIDSVMDIHVPMRASIVEKDDEKKMELRKGLAETSIPAWLANMEKALKAAGGEYFAGGKLSIGDIAIVARLNWIRDGSLDGIPTTIADGYPLLMSLVDRVMAEPKIVAYMEARPKK